MAFCPTINLPIAHRLPPLVARRHKRFFPRNPEWKPGFVYWYEFRDRLAVPRDHHDLTLFHEFQEPR
jgi:hypothetical protein